MKTFCIIILKQDRMEGDVRPFLVEGPMTMQTAQNKLEILKSLNMGPEYSFAIQTLLPDFTAHLSSALHAPRGWSFIPAGTDQSE